jgi:hypothetical protein
MKKVICTLLILIFSVGCAGLGFKGKSLSEDLGSPEKAALLRERAHDFWSAFVKEDYEKAYPLYDPFMRAKTEKRSFMANLGKIKYTAFEIMDIKIEGNVAQIKLKIDYSMPKTKMNKLEFFVPPTQREIEDKWIYVYDNWYKEYYSEMMGSGAADY